MFAGVYYNGTLITTQETGVEISGAAKPIYPPYQPSKPATIAPVPTLPPTTPRPLTPPVIVTPDGNGGGVGWRDIEIVDAKTGETKLVGVAIDVVPGGGGVAMDDGLAAVPGPPVRAPVVAGNYVQLCM